ncbi:AAA family ATPase [Sporosarcina beigongshangi]|uniref:AAA family ATPase n=1 Tax=Sporosarcina beigongshangi TaxID=2782538 RepID=UPI00193A8F16|nr:AAA family ATPase [Sporosarcina beigongshangi]
MEFYLVSHPEEIGKTKREGSYCELLTDNWNDYGYESYFTLYYFESRSKPTLIGPVKILTTKGVRTSTYLEFKFKRLDESFCSLGQRNSFYRNICKLPKEKYEKILNALRDTVFDSEILPNYPDKVGINDSFFRFSEAKNIYKNAKDKYFTKKSFKNGNFKFNFNFTLPYNNETKVSLPFNFEKNSFLPSRINIVVGKNGVGKTALLSSFADSLCGRIDNAKAIELFNPPEIPTFTKVIGISFSAFDNFRMPDDESTDEIEKHRELNNYIYCGIRDSSNNGTLSLEEIKKRGQFNIKKIIERDLENEGHSFLETWEEMLRNIEIPLRDIGEPESIFDKHLSSGQRILIATISEILAVIEDESILLFDEPELHLHPNAVSNFIRMLNVLLDEFNSYAIFSTHSPLIVQEVPSNYILKLVRTERNTLLVSNPITETFGENISDIVNEVFNVMENESNYQSILREQLKEMSKEEIISYFEKGLSMHALTYLFSTSKNMERK